MAEELTPEEIHMLRLAVWQRKEYWVAKGKYRPYNSHTNVTARKYEILVDKLTKIIAEEA